MATLMLLLAIPRALILASWSRVRDRVTDSATASNWEFRLAVAALPYSLCVGLAAVSAILHPNDDWDLVEIIVAIGYASVFPVSVGLRPSIRTAHVFLAIEPGVMACAVQATLSHLLLCATAPLLIQILRANMRIVYKAVIGHIELQH